MNGLMESFATMARRFFWSSAAVTLTGPHVRDTTSVQRTWNYFVIASLPAWAIGVWSLGRQTNLAIEALQMESVPGWRAGLLTGASLGFDPSSIVDCFVHGLLYFLPLFLLVLLVGAFWEALFARIRKRRLDEGLLVVAWFFTLMLPATAPSFQVAAGMTFGIVVGKLIFGGSGQYLVNPALLGIAYLVFAFPSVLLGEGSWVPVPGYDQPTVLELVTDEGGLKVVSAVAYDYVKLFIGNRPGSMGAISPLGSILGAIFLVWTGVASWRVLVGSLIGLIAMSLLFNVLAPGHPMLSLPWYWHLVLGAYLFGTVFLATDPVAGPMTNPGRWIFGLLVGGLTVLIRVGNPSYYEGILFAILLASLFSPLIDYVVKERNIKRRSRRMMGGVRD